MSDTIAVVAQFEHDFKNAVEEHSGTRNFLIQSGGPNSLLKARAFDLYYVQIKSIGEHLGCYEFKQVIVTEESKMIMTHQDLDALLRELNVRVR